MCHSRTMRFEVFQAFMDELGAALMEINNVPPPPLTAASQPYNAL